MKLDAWLKQDRPLTERLRLVERLAQALNEAHDRGEPLAALEPARIEVGSDSHCDLSAARKGSPSPEYGAPERVSGGPPSPESDVYSAGVIVWETLAGRPCGPAPTHLAEVRPDLPRELADAIMACLERSTEWRPKDLTYVAQLAQHAQAPRGGEKAATTRPAARAAATPSRAPSFKSASRRESRSQLPLAIAAALLIAGAGGSYYWLKGQGGGTAARTAASSPPHSPAAGVAPTPIPTLAPDPATPSAVPATTAPRAATPPPAAASTPTPAPVAVAPAAVAPVATPTPRPTPTPVPTNALPVTPSLPPPAATAPARTEATATESAPPAPAAAETRTELPSDPPVLATISPLSARRPGKIMFDLRGTGLHAALRARVVPVREAPRGITIAAQKCADPTLVKVLVDFDATVAPGAYAIVLEDATGRQTKPLTFTVAK